MEQVNTPTLDLTLTIANRQRLVAMKQEIEKQIEADTTTIKDAMIGACEDTYDAGEYLATLTVRERATLGKAELVAYGVSTELIKRATKVSEYIQLDVKAKK